MESVGKRSGRLGVWPEARSQVWVRRKLVSRPETERTGAWSQAGLREERVPERLAWGPPRPLGPFSERPLPPASRNGHSGPRGGPCQGTAPVGASG